MRFDVHQLYSEICGEDVFFAYEGKVSSEQINITLEDIEQRLVAKSIDLKARKKIYNIMVESLQNLFHHSDNVPKELQEKLGERFGIIVIKENNRDFVVTVGNFVAADGVKFLTEKIEKLNSLTKDELKEMYKFILNYQRLSSKGGGGLGLIDIARKSEKNLEYQFYAYNEFYYFYKLDIFITI